MLILIKIADSELEKVVEILCPLGKSKEKRDNGEGQSVCEGFKELELKRNWDIEYAFLTLSYLCCYSEENVHGGKERSVLEFCMGLVEYENKKIRRNALGLVWVLRGNHSFQWFFLFFLFF